MDNEEKKRLLELAEEITAQKLMYINMSENLFSVYTALKDAGFNGFQAFTLTRDYLTETIRSLNGGKNENIKSE